MRNDASYQKNTGILSDGQGGYIILWTDNRLAADRFAIFGQRMNVQGDLVVGTQRPPDPGSAGAQHRISTAARS